MSGSLADLIPLDVDAEAKGDVDAKPKNGGLTLVAPGVTINITDDDEDESDFGDNLALTFDEEKLGGVVTQLLTDIQTDDQSRSEWLETRAKGLALLGLQMQEPRGDVGATSAPLEGMSTVVSPLLLTEVLRAQATARGELLPADGPVKVVDDSTAGSAQRDELAEALEKDFNTYLTRVCSEYYPDTDRMLFYTVFGGSGFKKLYHCPIRNRPVSESVDAADLIVNAGATDLRNAQRVTHVITMRNSMVRRMMLAGAYRDIPLSQAFEQPNPVQEKKAEIQGLEAVAQQPLDQNRTIYECCCEWDFGEGPDNMPVPYRITIDKDARQVLDIRRNWREDDELYLAKQTYVRYPYVDAIGIYGIGLLHILGNTARAMTAAWREMLDAGMFSCFPGFLYGDNVARQETNNFRVPPGGGMKIQTGGQSIKDNVMALPYKEPSAVLMQLVQYIDEKITASASAADMMVGEGKNQAPVGTTMALLEQATKIESAVHKRMHAAQAEEFQLLADLLREDPEAFWRHGRRGIYTWDKETFIKALDTFELAPVADPNDPSRTHRLIKAQALKMLSMQNPSLYDVDAVDSHIIRSLGFSDPQEFFVKPGTPPPPNPMAQAEMAKLQEGQAAIAQKNKDAQLRLVETQIKAQQAAADRKSKEQIEMAKLAVERQKIGSDTAAEGIKGLHAAMQPAPEGVQ